MPEWGKSWGGKEQGCLDCNAPPEHLCAAWGAEESAGKE